jgi:hypothetical protein
MLSRRMRMPERPSVSPLIEASSASLDEYFSRRPPFDTATLAAIKAEFRRMRDVWQKAEEAGVKPRAKKAPKATVPPGGTQTTALDIFGTTDD